MDDDARWERIAALGGFAFVVLNVIATFLPGAQGFFVLATVVISTSGFGLVAHLAAVASLNYRKHMFPAWITYLGWVGALGFLVASFGAASDAGAFGIFGLVSFIVWCVWIVGISILMWQGAGQRPAQSPLPA